ncbi:MAG: hypothetical protein L0338_28135 [Acidobacteria bacterium]|nr:hypothetical protein [Acidobacteriota bacterium]
MISIVTYGRNDNYGYNLYKRTTMGFNCLAEVLTDEDEILFTDYNTAIHLPTLPEFVWDTLTPKARRLLKVIRVGPDLHAKSKGDSPLPILENVARNAAIVRSDPQNRWLLSTNPDILMILGSQWKDLPELLSEVPESFYEMPRFDIPESVWSCLPRDDPRSSMNLLENWILSNRAAVVEAIPDPRFQKFYLFDAPGDFQLAPRSYFFKLRGFDESMNKYLHSDANLAKRMWLLNGLRTDHLLGKLWVLHQDHYLSGEWARNVAMISHNDYHTKVLRQETVEANGEGWGLEKEPLPFFKLEEQIRKARHYYFGDSHAAASGDLPLSSEVDWRCQPFFRLCHYKPELLTIYLREILKTTPTLSSVVYLGNHSPTWEALARLWGEVGRDGIPICHLVNESSTVEAAQTDLLLVDCHYERPGDAQKRIEILQDHLRRQQLKGRISEDEANEEVARFANNLDAQLLESQLIPLWQRHFPRLRMNAGSHVVLLGCNTYVGIFFRFQEMFGSLVRGIPAEPSWLQRFHESYQRVKFRLQAGGERSLLLRMMWGLRLLKRRIMWKIFGYESLMGWIYLRHLLRKVREMRKALKLPTVYVHHRLVVMRVEE